jgi:hypothetical protein
LLACGSIAVACVPSARERPARGALAPPPRAEVPPPSPSANSVWIPGSWRWNGVEHVWDAGRWEAPRPTPGS